MFRSLAKASFGRRISNAQTLRSCVSPLIFHGTRTLSTVPHAYDPSVIRNCAIIAHVDHGELFVKCLLIVQRMFALNIALQL